MYCVIYKCAECLSALYFSCPLHELVYVLCEVMSADGRNLSFFACALISQTFKIIF